MLARLSARTDFNPTMAFRTLPFLILFFYLICMGIAGAQGFERPHTTSEIQRVEDIRQRTGFYNGTNSQERDNAYRQIQNAPSSPYFFDPAAQGRNTYSHATAYDDTYQTDQETQPSTIETMYGGRIIDTLEQYGYELFSQSRLQRGQNSGLTDGSFAQMRMPPGAVQDDFVLGAGDELEIVFTGQRNDRATYKVSSKGYLLIQDFPPVPVAGRSIGDVRSAMQALTSTMPNTEVFVSLTSVRQIQVLILGHVKRPGRQVLTVFDTVVDALMEAGGVEKTGSLRQIKLVRDGRSTIIDLYALMMMGNTQIDLQLRDGDRLMVPPVGPTVAVAGEVKRPGIYEIPVTLHGMYFAQDRAEKLSLNDMLGLGGGLLSPGRNRLLKLEITPDGQEEVRELHVDDADEAFTPQFGDGSVLMVSKGQERRSGMVELVGNARNPGLHALEQNQSLSALLPGEAALAGGTYPLIGVIERWDPELLAKTWIDFPLRRVVLGDYDRRLQDGDIVHLFSNAQILGLSNTPFTADKIAEKTPQKNDREEFTTLADDRFDQGSLAEIEDKAQAKTLIEDTALASFLRERSGFVRGAVRKPGAYPVSEGTTLDALLAVAGGLSLEANTGNIEITSALQGEGLHAGVESGTRRTRINLQIDNPANVLIAAGDAIRVNQKFRKVADNSVLVIGEVRNPGRYDLLPGDKVSDLLARAGGMTDQAYPEGAIFSRESERKAEEARFKSQGRAIKRSVAEALAVDEKKIDSVKIAEARALADELENAQGLGRITVEADPAALQVHPELDMLLESGDRLYIPKRSLTVRVNGEVLSPAALQFREGKKPLDYIHESGGFTFHADKDRTFVLYPDGSAQPLQVSSWNYNPIFIPPGSTIVVPRDPKPFDFIENAKDVSQILSNLAITAIFIDDVVNDDL